MHIILFMLCYVIFLSSLLSRKLNFFSLLLKCKIVYQLMYLVEICID